MIQRIQSLYLVLVFILTLLMFCFPLAHLIGADGQIFEFLYRGVPSLKEGEPMIYHAWPVAILLLLIALNSLVTLFLYKKRILQIRFTVFNILCMIGSMGLMYYCISSQAGDMAATTVSYEIPFIFPVISAILSYLAIRGIGKDEALIRSMDRIR